MPIFAKPLIRPIRSAMSSLQQAFLHLTQPSRYSFVFTEVLALI
jgi:hypothetical protein